MLISRRLLAALAGALLASSSVSASQKPASPLSFDEQWELALRFAPTFVYHPEETYFPCSPLFSLGAEYESRAQREALGTVSLRTSLYESLDLSKKLALARVFFEAYRLEDSEDRIVLEYWLYYVQNRYFARAGVIPLTFDTSHPNDLEHLSFILKRDVDGFTLEGILASAHSDKVPDNAYTYPEGAQEAPPILVELGSHAMAPDVNGDGRFTPGVDGDRSSKFTWGIRDTGRTWSFYNSTYMKPRDSSAILLSTYRLEHAHTLAGDYARLGLTRAEEKEIFQDHVSRFKRLFGRSNGESGRLVLPERHEDFGKAEHMRKRYGRNDCCLAFGYTFILAENTFFLGARKRFVNRSRFVPDLVLEGQAFLTNRGTDFYEAGVLGYYPVDAITKAFAGGVLITDSIELDRRELDWMAGLEFDVGPFKFRNALRTRGAVHRARFDFRVYFFPW